MNVAGIDLSSFAVDVVLLDEETDAATWHRYPLAGPTPFERTRSLRAVFPHRYFWEDNGVYLVGIEDPYSASKGVAKALGLVTGGIAALLPPELCVMQTAPTEWKRVFTGKANATKEEVTLRAIDVWENPPYCDGEDDNTFDAYGIAWAVREINRQALKKGAA